MPWYAGLLAAIAALAVGFVIGEFWRRRNGRLRPAAPGPDDASPPVDPGLLTSLGVRSGVPATLLQFSSAFCAPCRATRRICAEVVDLVEGVRHVEVDAEQNLDAVRALGVLRTPTLFVIDAEGRVVRRASGQPTKAHLIATIAPLVASSR
jgi:thiol-disulfide isomerase/thioredoxin